MFHTLLQQCHSKITCLSKTEIKYAYMNIKNIKGDRKGKISSMIATIGYVDIHVKANLHPH